MSLQGSHSISFNLYQSFPPEVFIDKLSWLICNTDDLSSPFRISVKPYGVIELEGSVRLNLCQQQKAPSVGMTW